MQREEGVSSDGFRSRDILVADEVRRRLRMLPAAAELPLLPCPAPNSPCPDVLIEDDDGVV